MIKNLFGILVIECERDKTCDIGEYLDYENCKCRKKLVGKLIDECPETIEELKLAKITLTENESGNKYSSYTVYIIILFLPKLLFILFITIGL